MFVVIFRAVLLYALIVLAVRLMGKRQLGELQPSELVTTILISNIASTPIEDPSLPMALGVVPILTIVIFEVLLSWATLKSARLRRLVSGKPMVIIENGTVDQKALKELRLTVDDLMESLRSNSVFDLEDVQYAVVETTGKISVQLKFKAQTVTSQMLSLTGSDPTVPSVVISDGKVVREALTGCGLDLFWLEHTLKENGVSPKDVFLMTADSSGAYHIIPKQKEASR